jgi:hypothetical protein
LILFPLEKYFLLYYQEETLRYWRILAFDQSNFKLNFAQTITVTTATAKAAQAQPHQHVF